MPDQDKFKDQLNKIIFQLSWCLTNDTLGKGVLAKMGLDAESAQAALEALEVHKGNMQAALFPPDPTSLLAQFDQSIMQKEPTTHTHNGYYIKTSTPSSRPWLSTPTSTHVNISVMMEKESGNVSLIIKPKGERKEGKSYFTGSTKRATKSCKLDLGNNNSLTISSVMSIKANSTTPQNIENQKDITSCYFVDGTSSTNSPLNRVYKTRYIQQDLGVDLNSLLWRTNNLETKKLPHLAQQYMTQVGEQLSNFHKQGKSHFDVKPGNILYDENRSQFTVIDYPSTAVAPNVKQNNASLRGVSVTEDTSIIPETSCRIGLLDDCYAYLRGLQEIAEQMSGPIGADITDFCTVEMKRLKDLANSPSLEKAKINSNCSESLKTFGRPIEDISITYYQKIFNKQFNTTLNASPTPLPDPSGQHAITFDVTLKNIVKRNSLYRLWQRVFSSSREISLDLDKAKNLSELKKEDTRSAGWDLVKNAATLSQPSLENRTQELARALIVAEVYYALPTSGPDKDMGELIKNTITARVQELELDSKPNDQLKDGLLASTDQIQEAIQAIKVNCPCPEPKAAATQPAEIQSAQDQPSSCPCPEPNASARKPIPDLKKVANVAAMLRCCCKPKHNRPQ